MHVHTYVHGHAAHPAGTTSALRSSSICMHAVVLQYCAVPVSAAHTVKMPALAKASQKHHDYANSTLS